MLVAVARSQPLRNDDDDLFNFSGTVKFSPAPAGHPSSDDDDDNDDNNDWDGLWQPWQRALHFAGELILRPAQLPAPAVVPLAGNVTGDGVNEGRGDDDDPVVQRTRNYNAILDREVDRVVQAAQAATPPEARYAAPPAPMEVIAEAAAELTDEQRRARQELLRIYDDSGNLRGDRELRDFFHPGAVLVLNHFPVNADGNLALNPTGERLAASMIPNFAFMAAIEEAGSPTVRYDVVLTARAWNAPANHGQQDSAIQEPS